MTILGDRFACEEVFIPELIMGGEIMKGIAAELKPRITADATAEKRGTVVIGTVHGDIHDIGKDVVVMMLEVSGYEVHDLGIDVPVADFVAAIRSKKPEVVGLSGLLTLAFDAMKDTIEGIAAAGLRDQVKIMIGGSPVDEQVCTYTAADGWGRDAAAALADGCRLDRRRGGLREETMTTQTSRGRARRTASEAVRGRGRAAQAGPRPPDAAGARVLPHAHGRASPTGTPATTPS